MALVHAPFCSRCHSRRTKHPSGLCCRCRKVGQRKPCLNCGETCTSHPSGFCYHCRSRKSGLQHIDKAISHSEKTLLALRLLKCNTSFQKIADVLGVSKHHAYVLCQTALRASLIMTSDDTEET